MDQMITIGQLSGKYSVSTRSIRHYEKLGILNSHRDNDSNYRLYGESESQRLYQILLLKSMGFTLKEISSVLGKAVSKNKITAIIENRIIDLDKKATTYQYCKEMLIKLVYACNYTEDIYVDCQQLLNQVIGSESGNSKINKLANELFYSQIEMNKIRDADLEFLREYRQKDSYCLNLYSLSMEQEDIDRLLYLLNAGSFKDFWKIYMPGETNLIEYIRKQDSWTFLVSQIYNLGLKAANIPLKSDKKINYRDIVIDLCNKLDIHYETNSTVFDMEKNLISSLFTNALLRYESIASITREGLGSVADILEISANIITKDILLNTVNDLLSDNSKLMRITIMIIDAECRHIYTGTGNNHHDEVQAISHELSKFTRVLDWSVKELWYYLTYLGQGYTVLMSIVLRIAYMRIKLACSNLITL